MIAAELGFLSEDEANTLSEKSSQQTKSPAEFALDSGYLGTGQIDIIKSLDSPTEIIPGYKLETLLGQGGMGVVYRAEQLNLGRKVAIKTILVSRMSDENALGRFEREAKTIGQLRHPNIISAFDFGRHSGRLFLALELVDGVDLDVRIKKSGPVDEWLALHLLRQSAAGLAHAAQHHVVHRDIKPANLILVDPPEGYPLPPGVPMVKIADFGLALLNTDADETTRLTSETTLGTPHYMAPEQLESSDVDLRADIYSLGASLIHSIQGTPPFAGMKLSQIVTAKFTGGDAAFANLPDCLHEQTRELLHRMMARNPEDRPQTYQELISEVDRILPLVNQEFLETSVDLIKSDPAAAIVPTMEFAPQTTQLDAVEETTSLPGSSKKIFAFAGIGIVIILGIAAFILLPPESNPPPLPVVRDPTSRVTGKSQHLLNGKDTGGWTTDHGSWIWSSTHTALEGTSGFIRRPIPGAIVEQGTQSPPLSWYRLEMIFGELSDESNESGQVQELHFGITPNQQDKYILRRSGEQIEIVPSEENSQADENTTKLSIPASSMIAITLDRLPSGWFVEINGNQFAAMPRREQELAEFQLKAFNGPVYFSDVVISEMSVETTDEE